MKHAAIPTTYNNVQMRSRLEARWAAFFDLWGFKWAYEPIDLPGWIPDFIVYDVWRSGNRILVEIKPLHERDDPLFEELSQQSRAFGEPVEIWVLGVNPFCFWKGASECEWIPAHFGDANPKTILQIEDLWNRAGNVVQWKSPNVNAHPKNKGHFGGSISAPEQVPVQNEAKKIQWQFDCKTGKIEKDNPDNVKSLLDLLGIKIRWNVKLQRMEVQGTGDINLQFPDWTSVDDVVVVRLLAVTRGTEIRFRPERDFFQETLIALAHSERFLG